MGIHVTPSVGVDEVLSRRRSQLRDDVEQLALKPVQPLELLRSSERPLPLDALDLGIRELFERHRAEALGRLLPLNKAVSSSQHPPDFKVPVKRRAFIDIRRAGRFYLRHPPILLRGALAAPRLSYRAGKLVSKHRALKNLFYRPDVELRERLHARRLTVTEGYS